MTRMPSHLRILGPRRAQHAFGPASLACLPSASPLTSKAVPVVR